MLGNIKLTTFMPALRLCNDNTANFLNFSLKPVQNVDIFLPTTGSQSIHKHFLTNSITHKKRT